ncbi:MAG: sulfurtransferase [Gammaproteobacteria bacterium]|nr:MAG: sulfurtransferase [Gammaproteobacteria bacterium]PCH63636.1 MAG: sulfurtransferase [Gammaproteobacteria bacterium]PCH64368.1 MAG: sulfurtransferase [Gammaproteobacteria bacterium]
MDDITPQELKELLEKDLPPIVIDVRQDWEYEKCHIEGSLLISMDQISDHIGEFDPEEGIVVVCHHGMRSAQVAQYLIQSGFTNIINLAGGLDAWAKELDPEMEQY